LPYGNLAHVHWPAFSGPSAFLQLADPLSATSSSTRSAGRQFVTWYGDKGGQRYHLTFGKDPEATHFVYEANVYLVEPAEVENVEMDMNQVMSDGRTVIFGVQCAAHSKSWEYTYVDRSGTHWHPSNIHCNPHDWGTKKWHKIQIASHRDDGGNVTYDWVNFDGVYTDFENARVNAAQALRWTPGELLLNFQRQIDVLQFQSVVDLRNVLARKLDVHDGADDLRDFAFRIRRHI